MIAYEKYEKKITQLKERIDEIVAERSKLRAELHRLEKVKKAEEAGEKKTV